MNKYNTKLGQLLSLLERPRFEKSVKATGADNTEINFWEIAVVIE